MPPTKSQAQHVLAHRSLTPRSQQIADYWLSLWDQNTPPARAQVNPAAIKPLLPGIIFFMVVPNMSVHVGMAGTGFRAHLGREITGADWLALTPESTRPGRLSVFSAVVHGAIACNHWRFPAFQNSICSCEKLLLPLRPEQGAAIPVLGHVDWHDARPHGPAPFELDAISPPNLLESVPSRTGEATC
ncbi:MAG: hypothetical protein BGN82_07800 [Alphaproteobacteria bacterium 65-7]|nr:MAG: hypothetical protein BGN82_07800 [Alphaproteobacteria bacterium 65-7]